MRWALCPEGSHRRLWYRQSLLPGPWASKSLCCVPPAHSCQCPIALWPLECKAALSVLQTHWLAAAFWISFVKAVQCMQGACWSAPEAWEKKQANLGGWWVETAMRKKMSYHKARSWENKSKHLETFIHSSFPYYFSPPPEEFWISCQSIRDRNVWLLKCCNCTHIGSKVPSELHCR